MIRFGYKRYVRTRYFCKRRIIGDKGMKYIFVNSN